MSTLDDHIKDVRSPLAKLLGEGPVPHVAFDDFEGAGGRLKGTRLAIRAIDTDAQERAVVDALKYLTVAPPNGAGWDRGDLYTELGERVLDLETKVQTLAVALVDPTNPERRFAANANELRKLLEPAEITALFERFAEYQEKRDPLFRVKTREEIESFLDTLGKGMAPPNWSTRCDIDSLRSIATGLEARLRTQTPLVCSACGHSNDSSA